MKMLEELDKLVDSINTCKPWEGGTIHLYFIKGNFVLYPAKVKITETPPLFSFSPMEINVGLTSENWGMLTSVIYQICKEQIIEGKENSNVEIT